MTKNEIQVGGQAVIEGVMMRSKDAYSVAVRRSDGSIYVRKQPYVSFAKKYKFLSLPVVRGGVVLIESLVLGVKALSFSGDVAMEDEQNQGQKNKPRKTAKQESFWSKMWLGLTVLFSLAVGLLIFFYVPLILTDYVGAKTGFMFNLIDGVFRLAIFLIYLFAITLIKDIRRVFQYHGAEHKSIFAFESKKELLPSEAKPLSRFHPRCGTSFLLIVMIVSIFVFMLLGKPNDVGERLLRLTLIPLIGGLSYELIRLSDVGSKKRFWKPLILPGLWLQRLTTKEPDERQLEVAIVALKCALGLDLAGHQNVNFEGKEALELETVKS